MKLRDRQDKVERVLSFYKSSKGSPFQESSTHVRGEVDVLGALLMMDNVDQESCDAISRAGMRTGVHSRFTFETTIRQKDTLVTEFVVNGTGQDDVLGSPLSLAKVFYAANISDWFSVVAIPVGAHCRDVAVAVNSPYEKKKALTNYSSLGPPLLNQHNGSAVGVMVRKTNVVASLAQFVTGLGMHPGSVGFMRCFNTFGQLVCQLPRNTKLSLLGIHQVPKFSTQNVRLGALAMPVGILKHRQVPETSSEASAAIGTQMAEIVSTGSMALMLESELDESTRIGGWLEMKRSNPRYLQWAVSMSDTPEDDFGWGLSLGGLIQGPRSLDHFQVEAFLNFNFGKRFSLQPALVYVMDGATKFPALMLQSSWSL